MITPRLGVYVLHDCHSAASVHRCCCGLPCHHLHAGKGGNFIDTAEVYATPMDPSYCGKTEEFVGRWLHKRGCRDEFIIATKVHPGVSPGRTPAHALPVLVVPAAPAVPHASPASSHQSKRPPAFVAEHRQSARGCCCSSCQPMAAASALQLQTAHGHSVFDHRVLTHFTSPL